MKHLLAIVAATAALSGCAGLITGGELIRPGEPTGYIQVVNQTRGAVNAVLISSCDASTYGLNRLPSGTSIAQGSSYSFQVSAGCWDVAAGTTGVGDARQRFNVPAGGTVRYTVTQ